jgi:3-oxoacyl-[acyl-carrier-protein] synthase-3
MTYSRIAGTGSYLPEKVVTNQDLEKMMDTSDEWIRERTGIKRRHLAADGEKTSDLALAAAGRAFESAGITAEDLDLIIVGTTTPDKVFPGTACIIQRRLGISGCGAFDIQAACSGFIYGLDMADRYIRTGAAQNVLVIGAETLSRLTDWEDRTTAVLFGDGAGAVVLQAADEPGIISTHIHADGQYEDLLQVPQGVSAGFDVVRAKEAYIQMNGNAVFRRAVATLDGIARETLEKNGVDKHSALPPRRRRSSTCRWSASSLPWTSTRILRPRRFRLRSTRQFATVASSAASCCCSRPLVRGSPGVPRCCASDRSRVV